MWWYDEIKLGYLPDHSILHSSIIPVPTHGNDLILITSLFTTGSTIVIKSPDDLIVTSYHGLNTILVTGSYQNWGPFGNESDWYWLILITGTIPLYSDTIHCMVALPVSWLILVVVLLMIKLYPSSLRNCSMPNPYTLPIFHFKYIDWPTARLGCKALKFSCAVIWRYRSWLFHHNNNIIIAHNIINHIKISGWVIRYVRFLDFIMKAVCLSWIQCQTKVIIITV